MWGDSVSRMTEVKECQTKRYQCSYCNDSSEKYDTIAHHIRHYHNLKGKVDIMEVEEVVILG